MDNLNSHSEHADQPQGQQANGLPSAVPSSQVLDTDMDMTGQDHTNLPPLPSSLEQDRLHMDQVRQFHNEQVLLQQQEMFIQNASLVNLVEYVTRGMLMDNLLEIASLRIELLRKQEYITATLYDRLQWMGLALEAYGINHLLIRRLPPVQQETNSHVASNQVDAPGSEDEASSVARTQPDLICKVCNSDDACMVLLPCQHLCACRPCGVRITACPSRGTAKGDAVVPRVG